MRHTRLQLGALGAALFLIGACDGARDVDYSRSRAISADIACHAGRRLHLALAREDHGRRTDRFDTLANTGSMIRGARSRRF
jgi:hypothetical protein